MRCVSTHQEFFVFCVYTSRAFLRCASAHQQKWKWSSRKNNSNKLWQTHSYFCWGFALLHQCLVITVTFKMLHTFLLKRTIKIDTTIKFCQSNNSNGKDLTVLFKMGLSRDINKLSFISKLILLGSLDKMVKTLKFMLQSQVSK